MRRNKTPDIVIRRLALYLRSLENLEPNTDDNIISSYELSELAGVSATQLRKDLALFGEFGKQGVGYNVDRLREEVRSLLNLHRGYPTGLVGAGGLGMALARYSIRQSQLQDQYPFQLVAMFDNDPVKIGMKIDGVPIYDVGELATVASNLGLQIVIISVPAGSAQDIANVCVAAGIRAMLSFAPIKLSVPAGFRVHYADLSLELRHLAYYL
jgi:redox-sensing transcriptional repressor